MFSLARDAEFGRFVVANKDLGVGDTVMEVAGLIKEMEWTAFCGLCGLSKEIKWTAFCVFVVL